MKPRAVETLATKGEIAMRRTMLGLVAAAFAAAMFGGGAVLVEHGREAQELLCGGARTSDGKCDLVWINWSIESRATWDASGNPQQQDGKRVNCPKATRQPKQPECFQNYEDTRSVSPGWGSATAPVVSKTAAGPVEFGGVYFGGGSHDARVWTGVRAQGQGSGSAAFGAGRQSANGRLYECLTLFGADETPNKAISGALNDAGISDDRSDYETDVQFCGELARGVV